MDQEKTENKELEKKSEENMLQPTELIELKSMKYGIIGMVLVFIVLILISMFKNTSPAALVGLICAYNSVTFLSRYKMKRNRTDLVTGIIFFVAVIFNTAAFILS